MDRTLQMEKHHVEAWGLWWAQWQSKTKERLQKQSLSPKAFVDQHLVSSESKGLLANTTSSSVVTLVLSPK
jgi:hypothetical protein